MVKTGFKVKIFIPDLHADLLNWLLKTPLPPRGLLQLIFIRSYHISNCFTWGSHSTFIHRVTMVLSVVGLTLIWIFPHLASQPNQFCLTSICLSRIRQTFKVHPTQVGNHLSHPVYLVTNNLMVFIEPGRGRRPSNQTANRWSPGARTGADGREEKRCLKCSRNQKLMPGRTVKWQRQVGEA